jgi:hypothetical protein
MKKLVIEALRALHQEIRFEIFRLPVQTVPKGC